MHELDRVRRGAAACALVSGATDAVPSRLTVFPEENHWILRGENRGSLYAEIHAWLARWLK